MLAAELVQRNVGTSATRAASAATATIPIVFFVGANPVERGLVAQMARPGGNLTGYTYGVYDSGKLLEILKEAIPHLSVVAFPLESDNPATLRSARALGIEMVAIPTKGPEELAAFFAKARAAHADAAVMLALSWTGPHERQMAELALTYAIPTIGNWRDYAADGGLFSYGSPQKAHWPRLAVQVDRILRGELPGGIAVEQPTHFEFVINRKTAKALGVTIPQSLLLRADEVIQ